MSKNIKPFYNDYRDFHHDTYNPENLDLAEDLYKQETMDIIDSQWDAIMSLDLEKLTGKTTS